MHIIEHNELRKQIFKQNVDPIMEIYDTSYLRMKTPVFCVKKRQGFFILGRYLEVCISN